MSEPVLTVSNLTIGYRDSAPPAEALNDVSFTLGEGATLGVIGESGSGKTSMALGLVGLLDPSAAEVSGNVIFEERNLLELAEPELCKIRGGGIGMIFQDPKGSLNPAMRVDRQVSEALRLHLNLGKDEARRQARSQLAEAGVGEDVLGAAPYPYQLSGGLAQRVMIAMALSCSPRLLIADEPTSSLDVTLQAQIIRLLKERQQNTGLAMIFISHDLALVSAVADTIMVLRNGNVVEYGKLNAVLSRPSHDYTADLISAWKTGQGQTGSRVATA